MESEMTARRSIGVAVGFLVLMLMGSAQCWGSTLYEKRRELEPVKNEPQHEKLYGYLERFISEGDTELADRIANVLLVNVHFSKGLEAMKQGDLADAAEAFERVVEIDPRHHRARLELARARFAMRQYDSAREEFERVRATDPPASVQRNIERFLHAMPPEGRRTTLSTGVTVGLLYDDNVNFGLKSAAVDIAPIDLGLSRITTLRAREDSLAREDWGGYLEVAPWLSWDPGQAGAWSLESGGIWYQTWLDDGDNYDILYLSALTGPRYTGEKRLLDLPVRYEYVERGSDALLDIVGFHPSWVVSRPGGWHWATAVRVEYRDYRDQDSLDAVYSELRETLRQTVGRKRHILSAGLAGFYEMADDDIYTNEGLEPSLSAYLKLPGTVMLGLRAHYRVAWYDEQEPLAPESRRDDELQGELQIDKPIADAWRLMTSYQYTRHYSTFDLYEFERNAVTFSLNAQF